MRSEAVTINIQLRALILLIGIPIVAGVSGCEHIAYFAPSGPGSSVIGYGGAPSVRRIKIGSDLEILMSVQNYLSPARLSIFMNLRKGVLRLKSPDVRFVCQSSEAVLINIEKVTGGAIVESAGTHYDIPWQSDLVGEGTKLASGGVSSGSYWIETLLPACAQSNFSVEIPNFSGTISGFPTEPVVFRLREGRFIPFTQWM